jgi:hypothetical protein
LPAQRRSSARSSRCEVHAVEADRAGRGLDAGASAQRPSRGLAEPDSPIEPERLAAHDHEIDPVEGADRVAFGRLDQPAQPAAEIVMLHEPLDLEQRPHAARRADPGCHRDRDRAHAATSMQRAARPPSIGRSAIGARQAGRARLQRGAKRQPGGGRIGSAICPGIGRMGRSGASSVGSERNKPCV